MVDYPQWENVDHGDALLALQRKLMEGLAIVSLLRNLDWHVLNVPVMGKTVKITVEVVKPETDN